MSINVYRSFYLCAIVVAVIGILCFVSMDLEVKRFTAFASIIGILILAVMSLGFRSHWNGTGDTSRMLEGGGLAFIVGGASFDVLATLHHSPDLTHEANPIATSLIEGGLGVTYVLAAGLVAQLSLVAVAAMLWMNFVKRLEWYKAEISGVDGMGLLGRVLGAADNSWYALLGGRLRHDVAICALGFFVLPVFAYRWYLGLEWFGLVPISRIVVPVLLMLFAIAFLLAWGGHVVRDQQARS